MPISWQTLLAIGCGGFLGAIARAYTTHFSNKYIPIDFPIGVLIANILGSFIIGCLISHFETFNASVQLKSFLITGFLGALTTYSTFAIETFILLQTSFYLGLLNAILNLLGTITAAGIGYKLIHFLAK